MRESQEQRHALRLPRQRKWWDASLHIAFFGKGSAAEMLGNVLKALALFQDLIHKSLGNLVRKQHAASFGLKDPRAVSLLTPGNLVSSGEDSNR